MHIITLITFIWGRSAPATDMRLTFFAHKCAKISEKCNKWAEIVLISSIINPLRIFIIQDDLQIDLLALFRLKLDISVGTLTTMRIMNCFFVELFTQI